MIDNIIRFDAKKAERSEPAKVINTAERLSLLGKKVEAEPDAHKFLLAMTASGDLSKFDWVTAGKPPLPVLLGLMTILKSEIFTLYGALDD